MDLSVPLKKAKIAMDVRREEGRDASLAKKM